MALGRLRRADSSGREALALDRAGRLVVDVGGARQTKVEPHIVSRHEVPHAGVRGRPEGDHVGHAVAQVPRRRRDWCSREGRGTRSTDETRSARTPRPRRGSGARDTVRRGSAAQGDVGPAPQRESRPGRRSRSGRPRRPRARSPIATRRRPPDEAADPEPHGRRRADQPHPEDVDAEPEVGGLGRRPDPGRPERDGGRERHREGMEAHREGHPAPDLSGRAGSPAERGHREAHHGREGERGNDRRSRPDDVQDRGREQEPEDTARQAPEQRGGVIPSRAGRSHRPATSRGPGHGDEGDGGHAVGSGLRDDRPASPGVSIVDRAGSPRAAFRGIPTR